MANERRSRRSGCPIAYALDIFGDRWSLLVLRDLVLLGKRRFRELLESDEGIASNILAERLRRLECKGILTKRKDPEDGRRVLYDVTDLGQSLLPVLLEISAWGASHDERTGAPPAFAKDFYANREAYYRDHRARLRRIGKV